jgi:hypothetical protein
LQGIHVRDAFDLHVVALVRPAGAGDARRPSRVVAEQQQAFAGLVQPSNRREPGQGGVAQAFVHRVAPLLVARGRDQAARLVHRHHHALYPGVAHAFHFDAVDACPHREFRIGHALVIHAHAPFRDPARGLRPRAQAQLGDGARDAVAWRGGVGFTITGHVISM